MTIATLLTCLKIFFARILDVSLGTVRTMFTVKGKSTVASLIGFVEIMVWFLAVRTAFNSDEAGLLMAFFYAGGYATGTLVGSKIAEKVIRGTVSVQVVTSSRDDNVTDAIRNAGYAITVVNVNGSEFGGEKYMYFAEVNTNSLTDFKTLIYTLDPKCFVTVQETKYAYNGLIK